MNKKYKKHRASPAEEGELLYGRRGLITESLAKFNRHLSPSEKTVKYQKMASSPYSFFRGSNHLFWQDFEWDWRMTHFGNYCTRTWINGDCHAYNFGAYDAHGLGIVYGLNDFDEAIIADYQYDLWRLAISLVLIGKETKSFSKKKKQSSSKLKIGLVLDSLSDSYLQTLSSFSKNKKASEIYFNYKNTKNPLKKFLKKTASSEGRSDMIKKWTKKKGEKIVFDRSLDEIADLAQADYDEINNGISSYIDTLMGDIPFPDGYFNVLDIVLRQSAGTGSLGSMRYYVLIQGNSVKNDQYIILDIKEQNFPSAFPFATDVQKSLYKIAFPNEGIRYAEAYRALDYHPDDHLGWMKIKDKYFGVRERNPFKKSLNTDKYIKTTMDFRSLAKSWGAILATEHSRADRVNNYPLGKEVSRLTKGKEEKFKKVVRKVAQGYADVVRSDYNIFVTYIAEE